MAQRVWLAAVVDDEGGGGLVAFFVIVALSACVIGLVSLVTRLRRRRFAAMMQEFGLSPVKSLPSTFNLPSGPWQPEVRIEECFSGKCRGFEAVVFWVQVGSGDGATQRYSVAVRRAPWPQQVVTVQFRSVEIDSVSTPGWILGTVNESIRNFTVIRKLLILLTAVHPPAPGNQPSSL